MHEFPGLHGLEVLCTPVQPRITLMRIIQHLLLGVYCHWILRDVCSCYYSAVILKAQLISLLTENNLVFSYLLDRVH